MKATACHDPEQWAILHIISNGASNRDWYVSRGRVCFTTSYFNPRSYAAAVLRDQGYAIEKHESHIHP